MDDIYMPKLIDSDSFSFLYGDEKIVYQRFVSAKNFSKVIIKVLPSCTTSVYANSTISDEAVLQAVKKRARWISKKLAEFKTQYVIAKPKLYISGECHFYLGRRYMLKVLVDETVKPTTKLSRGKLEVYVKSSDITKVKNQLEKWYRNRAKLIFNAQLMFMLSHTNWVTQTPHITIKAMSSQWGSCSSIGRLTLNLHLIKAPKEAIDYVILHELCHLVEHNHSENFYRLLNQLMPNWNVTKSKLDLNALHYLNQ